MKKIICMLGMISIVTMGAANLSTAQTVQTTTKTKKGWSNKGKGAAIGAGAGAASGAVLSRNNRAGGAVVGGAVGAGAGYLIGRHKDNKNPSRTYKTKTKTEVKY